MKKLFTLLVLLCALPVGCFAQTIFETGNIQYKVTDADSRTVGTYQDLDWMGMTGWYNYSHAKGDVVIPAAVTNGNTEYTVTACLPQSFYWHEFLESVEIPETVVSIGQEAFRGMSRSILKSVVIKGCESIGKDAFRGCLTLEKVVFPENLKYIGEGSFENCNLEEIRLPESVEVIAPLAFGNNAYLEDLYNYSPTPQLISGISEEFNYDENPVFQNLKLRRVNLHVPASAVAAYQAAEVWKEFNIVAIDDADGINDITVDNESLDSSASVEIYDLSGHCVAKGMSLGRLNLASGIYIVRQGAKVRKLSVK